MYIKFKYIFFTVHLSNLTGSPTRRAKRVADNIRAKLMDYFISEGILNFNN